jgi:hypothetical protein
VSVCTGIIKLRLEPSGQRHFSCSIDWVNFSVPGLLTELHSVGLVSLNFRFIHIYIYIYM